MAAEAKNRSTIEARREKSIVSAWEGLGKIPPVIVSFGQRDVRDVGGTSLREAIIFFEDFAQFVVRERDDLVILDSGHGFSGDHGIDHGFFSSLNG